MALSSGAFAVPGARWSEVKDRNGVSALRARSFHHRLTDQFVAADVMRRVEVGQDEDLHWRSGRRPSRRESHPSRPRRCRHRIHGGVGELLGAACVPGAEGEVMAPIVRAPRRTVLRKVEVGALPGPGGSEGFGVAEAALVSLGRGVVMRVHHDRFRAIERRHSLGLAPARVLVVFGILEWIRGNPRRCQMSLRMPLLAMLKKWSQWADSRFGPKQRS